MNTPTVILLTWLVITKVQSDKLQAGYRAQSRHLAAMYYHSHCCILDSLIVARHIFHRRVSYCTLSLCMSALCTYLTFGHYRQCPLGYGCAKFCICPAPHCWASPQRKITYAITHSVTHSLTQIIWYAGNPLWKIRCLNSRV